MIGNVFLDPSFYSKGEKICAKYIVILGNYRGLWVVRLVTSQSHGRGLACSGDPYPSFFLGTITPFFNKNSWLDLRY
jgi:hypothetical protein